MRTIASTTAARSFAGSSAQTWGRFTFSMTRPLGEAYSLENRDQICNGSRGQKRRIRAWFLREIGAAHGNISEPVRKDLDLTMTDVPWQAGKTRQLQNPTEQRMTRISNGNLTVAHLRDQRCITLAVDCRRRFGRRRRGFDGGARSHRRRASRFAHD
jgi:hypothetical protein